MGEACGILVPQRGIELVPPAVEARVLTTGPPGRSVRPFLEHSNGASYRWIDKWYNIIVKNLGSRAKPCVSRFQIHQDQVLLI